MEKRRKMMQEFDDLRNAKIEVYNGNRERRIDLRNGKSGRMIFFTEPNSIFIIFAGVDTDETEGRGGELEEEIVEFFVKQETSFIDE